MYTLRRISSLGGEMNSLLGKSYTVIHRDNSPELFEKDYRRFFKYDDDAPVQSTLEDPYAFVGSEDGHIHALYPKQKAYIMTSDGKTFSNLSPKDLSPKE